MLPFVPALQILTVDNEFTAPAGPVRCGSCNTGRGLRLVGMLPFAVVWCPACGTAWHEYAVTADQVAELVTDDASTWVSPMAEGLPADALAGYPGIEEVVAALSTLHRTGSPPAWCIRDWPSVQRPHTRGQLERTTAMIDAFHSDIGESVEPNVIIMVPTTRHELGVLQHATFQHDPLPPDQAIVRNIFIDLGARRSRLQHTVDAWTVRRTLIEWSRGAATIMWATHWLTNPDITSHIRPDHADELRRQVRYRNEQVAAAWVSDAIAKDDGPPDHPIMVPVTMRELAALRAGTQTQPGPDTIGMFLDDWNRRAQATTTGEPDQLQHLINQHASGAAWAAQSHWSNRDLVDNAP